MVGNRYMLSVYLDECNVWYNEWIEFEHKIRSYKQRLMIISQKF